MSNLLQHKISIEQQSEPSFVPLQIEQISGMLQMNNLREKNHSSKSVTTVIERQQIQQVCLQQYPNSRAHTEISYRGDIDGLRSLAILSVIVFHAWPDILHGGFTGVDIFFVISGFLITKIVLKQSISNKFSYIDFYSRRIKRIFPALIAVLLFILFVATNKLPRRHLELTIQTITASTMFGANIQVLTYEKDYFDPDTKTNPVLHLWSLGVEQQFYILWPLIIRLVSRKFTLANGFYWLVGYTILCFVGNIVAAYTDIKFDFYFPFCRFWQMAIGGLISFKNIKIKNTKIIHFLSTFGLGLILIGIWNITQNSLFPGWWALFPTIGSALIIQAGPTAVINKFILNFRPLRFIGKISYSLYLWHWPLLVFSRVLYPIGSLSIFSKTEVIVIVAFLCKTIQTIQIQLFHVLFIDGNDYGGAGSMLIYNNLSYFEQKLSENMKKQFQYQMIPKQQDYYMKNGRKIVSFSRNKDRQPTTVNKIKLSKFVLPWHQRFTKETLLDKKIDSTSKFYRNYTVNKLTHYEVANQGKKNLLLLVGDSHGRFTGFRLGQLYKQAVKENRTQQFPTIVCITFSGLTLLPYEDNYKYVTSWIEQFKPNRILFVWHWSGWYRKRGGKGWIQGINQFGNQYYRENVQSFITLVQKLQHQNISVIVSTYNPQGKPYNPNNMIDSDGIIQKNIKPLSLKEYKSKYTYGIELMQNGIKKAGGEIIDFSDNMCYQDVCHVLTSLGYCLFFDDDHFTTIAAKNWLNVVDHLTVF